MLDRQLTILVEGPANRIRDIRRSRMKQHIRSISSESRFGINALSGEKRSRSKICRATMRNAAWRESGFRIFW